MKLQPPQNPLLELAHAINEIDSALNELDRIERDIVTARSRLTKAKSVVQQTFGSACIEAQRFGCEIPRNYQRGDTLIRIDDTSHEVDIERLRIGTAYDLKRIFEKEQEEAL